MRSHLRQARGRAVPSICLFASILLAVASACSKAADASTGPGDYPSAIGRYQRTDQVAAISCSPQTPPAGGDIAFDPYTLVEPVQITQSGSKVSLTFLNYPGDPPDTGTIDMAGKVRLGFKLSFRETKPRDGNRQFFVDVTGTFQLDRQEDGARWTGTGTYENVFHEGSSTAPVFTTCSRNSSVELTRTGG